MKLWLTIFCSVCSIANAQHHFMQIPAFETAYPPERVVAIPAGETVAMPSGDIDLLWIEGTCVAPRDADLNLKVREIIVAPGGRLDMGTEADPVLGNVTVTFADGEFTGDDPDQWGHGLLVFGDWNACGVDKAVWSEGAGSGEPIAMSGDALSVMGQLFVDGDNTITFNSENPAGTRGHIIVSDHAECMIKNVSLVGLGRTKPEELSSTNLVGRYPLHFHHSMGASRIVKNVFCDGLDYRTKWGIVVHGSSWVTIEGCVATRTAGGFVTEDGSEVGNRFIGNLAYGNKLSSLNKPSDVRQGFFGAGFWFKSMVQYIDDNVSVGNSIGLQSAITAPDIRGVPETGQRTSVPQMTYQTSPGGPIDGVVTVFQSTLSGKRNRFVGNRFSGFDCWGSVPQTFSHGVPGWYRLHALPCHFEDCLFAWNGSEFSGGQQVIHAFTQSCAIYENCRFVGGGGYGVVNSIDYHRVLYFDGCLFEGMKYGAMTGRGAIFQNNTFNCDVGIVADRLSAQDWPYGMTISDNIYAGTPIEYRATDRTIDDIPLHQVTLNQVYANVQAFRNSIAVADDPNAAEQARLQAEIDSLNEQIAGLMLLLADLQSQLEALD